MSRLSASDQAVFRALADRLLPAAGGLPAATAAGVPARLDAALDARPDKAPDFMRALAACRTMQPQQGLEWLQEHDRDALKALRFITLGCYYADAGVREAMGYPGQLSRPVDPDAPTDFLDAGLTGPVVARGPVWRSADGTVAEKKDSGVGKHVFLAFTRPVEGREDEFNAWQDGEHVPFGLKQNEFVRATRYRLAGAQFAPWDARTAYLTIWEIESDNIAETLARAMDHQKDAVWTEAIDGPATLTAVYSAICVHEKKSA